MKTSITMPLRAAPMLLSLLLAAPHAQAQLYKWTGADGKIHYSDAAPPASARKVEQKNLNGGDMQNTSGLSYELAEAVRNHPVVLYTTPKCAPCEQGRALLAKRGIPYAEKTVVSGEDIAKLREAGGDQQLPFLAVGSNKQQGYEPGAWNAALSAAAYPESAQLPRNFKNPQAAPAAGAALADADAPAANGAANPNAARPGAPLKTDAQPVQGKNVPPGFRF